MASEELLEWCSRHGVVWHGIQSGFVAEGWRGVLATQDLEADTCVLRVPERLLLTARSARQDPLLLAMLDAEGQNLNSTQVLAVHLLHEVSKGEGSFWWPYLRSLPRTYTTAMCFRPGDIEALQVPYAQQAAEAAVEAALAQWRGALPTLKALQLPPKWLSKQAWLWAASTLSSRTMYVPYDPAGALTPFGDLHNYAPPPPPLTPCLHQRQRVEHAQQESELPAVAARQAAEQHAAGNGPGQVAAVRISQPLASFQQRQPQRQPHLQQECTAGGSTCGSGRSLAMPSTAAGLASNTAASAGQGAALAPAEQDSPNGREVPRQLAGAGPAGDCGPSAASSGSGGNGSNGSHRKEQGGNGGKALGSSSTNGSNSGGPGCDSGGAESELCGDGSLDVAAKEYRICVRRRYRDGEQVFLCYGRHTNLELLEHYGFVLPSNSHDTALLPPSALPPEAANKLPGTEEAYVHANGAPSWELLRALRLWAATPEERRTRAYLALQDAPISAASEARTLRALRAACAAALGVLPTTAQQDEELLQQKGDAALGECGWLAVEWRLGHKRALLRCIELCEAALRDLG